MNTTTLSDTVLLEQIETRAGVTNENILSEEELLQGKALLASAQEQLQRLNEQIMKLHIALAPQKRIPLEILEQIFLVFVDPDRIDRFTLPIIRDPPWVLGQVCTAWRHLSRSLPDLWRLDCISVVGDEIKLLQRALYFLPKVSQITINVGNSSKSTTRLILPILPRVHKLLWNMTYPGSAATAWKMLPAHALSSITTLNLSLSDVPEKRKIYRGSVEVFGETPCLENLHFEGISDVLLARDLPWSRLTSLSIVDFDANFGERKEILWKELSRSRPFGAGPPPRLTSLSLDIPQIMLPPIMALQLPLQQLTIFRVVCRTESELPTIIDILRECHISLKELELCLLYDHVSDNIRPRTFQMDALILPHLETLELVFDDDVFLIPKFTTPYLTKFTISTRKADVRAVIDYLTHSDCHLLEFLFLTSFPTRVDLEVDPRIIEELLTHLASCSTINLHCTIPHDMLDDIATGTLLPRVANIDVNIDEWSVSAFFSMIERKLQNDRLKTRRSCLQMACAVVQGDEPCDPTLDDASRINELRRKYGLHCELKYKNPFIGI